MIGYLYIAGTILFTIFGQVIIKWRISHLKFDLPSSISFFERFLSLFKLVLDPMIIAGMISAFIASLFWMAAMTKFELTFAYPFMSLSPALVFLIGVFFLGEQFTIGKILGLVVIILGIFITVKF